MYKLRVKLEKLGNYVSTPDYSTDHSSGVDLVAAINKEISIPPGKIALIPTGIKIEIPEGYEGQVRSRSGLALKSGVMVLNSPGTIDADYRGEVGVILANFGSECFVVKKGDRIAQLVFSAIVKVVFEEDELTSTVRGSGGFGHTGVRNEKKEKK